MRGGAEVRGAECVTRAGVSQCGGGGDSVTHVAETADGGITPHRLGRGGDGSARRRRGCATQFAMAS